MQRIAYIGVAAAAVVAAAVTAGAHCQIPCGIYDDTLRILMMREHVTTIEKSVRLVGELAGKSSAADVNQVVRWIENKDTHADELAEIAVAYFLQQRVKAPEGDDAAARSRYLEQLEALHALVVGAMKAKQTVDPEIGVALRAQIDRFAAAYFTEEQLKVLAEHAR